MTTPATMNNLLARLKERLSEATAEAKEISKGNPNCYGAGYGWGFVAAIQEMLTDITCDIE